MAEKKFLSWVGFKGEPTPTTSENETPTGVSSSQSPASHIGGAQISSSHTAGSQSNVARIRDLENQLAELRSRRDITSLTKEEFEILASETAMTLIKTAQARESKALHASQQLLNDSSRTAKEQIDSAESKAKSILSQAESRGRKYIETAQADSEILLADAGREAEQLLNAKKREAVAVTAAAKREAETMISEAVSNISEYRGWLSTAISEADRLHKIQSQSLNAAEQAIEQTRNRLASAFEKLAALQSEIDENLDANNRPKTKTYTRANGVAVSNDLPVEPTVKKSPKKATAAKKQSKKVSPKAGTSKKSNTSSSSKKPAVKKVTAKKSAAKRK